MRALLTASLVTSLIAGGCAVYRPEVRQGNYLDMSKVEQVKPGMTRDQVEFLMGPPMLSSGFRGDRWDYLFTLQSVLTNDRTARRLVRVWFANDVVSKVEIEETSYLGEPNKPAKPVEPAKAPAATPASAPAPSSVPPPPGGA